MDFFFKAEDGIRGTSVTGVQTCALPIDPEAESLEQHLLECTSCFQTVKTLHGEDTLVEAIRAQAASSERPRSELVAELMERLRSEERRVGKGGKRRGRRSANNNVW